LELFLKSELLQYAASLEQSSEHPIAVGVMQKAKEENLKYLRQKILMLLPERC
jgi:cation transport ATPase